MFEMVTAISIRIKRSLISSEQVNVEIRSPFTRFPKSIACSRSEIVAEVKSHLKNVAIEALNTIATEMRSGRHFLVFREQSNLAQMESYRDRASGYALENIILSLPINFKNIEPLWQKVKGGHYEYKIKPAYEYLNALQAFNTASIRMEAMPV